jgi:hypothetical protein
MENNIAHRCNAGVKMAASEASAERGYLAGEIPFLSGSAGAESDGGEDVNHHAPVTNSQGASRSRPA